MQKLTCTPIAVILGLIMGCDNSPLPPPNVVIIFADDLGYADIGAFGNPPYPTPHLDELVEDGVRLTNFYVSQPVCSASRASLLTGSYANRIGIHQALGPRATHGIHEDEVTLGELFQSKGYATALYGKWHLGHHEPFLPTRHGFDDFYGIPYSNDMWPYHPESPENWGDLPTIDYDSTTGYNTDQSRFTTDFTERSVSFISESVEADRPFFVYLAHPMPHVPLFVSEERTGQSGAGMYGDVIHEIDWSLGEIRRVLKEADVLDNTIIIFTSDNGPWLSYGNHAGSSGPLREGKGTTFEGGIRVPFIAAWPDALPRGLEVTTPAMTIDIFPTLAGLIDAPLPPHPIDGKDIWPVLAGEQSQSPQEAYFFWYGISELQAMRSGDWKLHFPHSYRSMEGRELGADGIPGKYDYTRQTEIELYNLASDIGETQNLAGQHPEVVARLTAMADRQRALLGDKLTDMEGTDVRPPGRIMQ